jgi:hypothetical protein
LQHPELGELRTKAGKLKEGFSAAAEHPQAEKKQEFQGGKSGGTGQAGTRSVVEETSTGVIQRGCCIKGQVGKHGSLWGITEDEIVISGPSRPG